MSAIDKRRVEWIANFASFWKISLPLILHRPIVEVAPMTIRLKSLRKVETSDKPDVDMQIRH